MVSSVKIMSDTRITSAEFGDYHYRRFLQWSFAERQSKAAFLRNLAVARTEANRNEIDDPLLHYSKLYGLPLEELLDAIYNADQNNISVAQLHQRLEAGLRGDALWDKKGRKSSE